MSVNDKIQHWAEKIVAMLFINVNKYVTWLQLSAIYTADIAIATSLC